jgi:hypothetical protein
VIIVKIERGKTRWTIAIAGTKYRKAGRLAGGSEI